MTPYKHQQKHINEVILALRNNQRVLFQASTGYGKTVVASFLIKYFTERGKRVLFIVDSEDLVRQTCEKLIKFGVPNEKILSKTKTPKHFADCYVSMERSLYNRLEKDSNYLKNIDIIISDECHILVHEKLYAFFPDSKVLGMTATPVILKRDTFFKCEVCKSEYKNVSNCCGGETMEWSRPFAMASIYNSIVVSSGIDWLIEKGYLSQDISIVKKSVDTTKLKKDSSGEFTNSSQTQVFSDEFSLQALVNDYLKFCKGKKTILFTSSTKINNKIVELLNSSGANAKSYDSRNNKKSERTGILDWFENTRDSVLVNTGCFVKGLDVTDIECIIGYLSTNSLSKYLQYVGRAGRVTKKIFKDNFIHIDYGDNIERFGEWSDPTRDWERIFYKGIGEPRPKKEVLEVVTQCDGCGILYPSSMSACPSCGETPKPKKKKVQKGEDYVLEPLRPMPSPSGSKIIEYTKYMGKDVNFAFKVLSRQVVDLFRFYQIDKELYNTAKNSGELDTKIDRMIQKAYFVIIRSGLTGKNRRLKTVIEAIKLKIEKYYEDV